MLGSLSDAMIWFRRAAEQGHAEAQYQLSLAYLNGGEATASRWYRHAAAVDKEIAERNRDLIFPNGLSVKADQAEALRWCRAAAEQGLGHAAANLGLMYARGLGCDIDYVEARRWYLVAAAQGNAAAELGLGVIYANGFGVESRPDRRSRVVRESRRQGQFRRAGRAGPDVRCRTGS